MNGADVVGLVPSPTPEALEGGAAKVSRVFAPEELAHELVVEADQVRSDERGIGADERRGIGRDELESGQHPVATKLDHCLPHGIEELRATHDRVEVVARSDSANRADVES